MTNFAPGQRVRSTVTEEARKEYCDDFVTSVQPFIDMGLGNADLFEEDLKNNANSPVVGDIGTVVDICDDGFILVDWDRDIGPIAGERTEESHWYVTGDDIAPVEGELEAAA